MTDQLPFKVGDMVTYDGKEERGEYKVVRTHESGRHVYCVNAKNPNTTYWISTACLRRAT